MTSRVVSYLFDLQNVARNDIWSFDLEKTTITENDSLEGESLLQFVDDRASLELLDKTDSSVQQKQGADDPKIDPILETSSEHSGGLSQRLLSARFRERWGV